MVGVLKEHHFITPTVCIEKGTILDILPGSDNSLHGVQQLVCRVGGTHLLALIPADLVDLAKQPG